MSETTPPQSPESLRSWLATRVAAYVHRSVEEILPSTPFADYGLSSVYALTLAGDIEDHLGLMVDATLVWDHPTIDALTEALLRALGGAEAARAPRA